MPQRIDVLGLFIDPETITDLLLQKRISVFYPVFYEVASRSPFLRSQKHVLQFDHLEPYGIILSDEEQIDTASFVVDYKQAVVDRILKGVGKAGKSISGHIAEKLRIEVSGDRRYRILQPGRNVKQTSIREIPAKVQLLNGQWVDVFKSSPEYDFQGGSPYAVTDVGSAALMISTKGKSYVLFGAGIDAADEDVLSAYHSLTGIFNEIQARHDLAIAEQKKRPLIQMPQIKIQLPTVRGKKQERALPEALPESSPEETVMENTKGHDSP